VSKREKRKTKKQRKAEERAARLGAVLPTAEQIARGRGTPAMVGAVMRNQPGGAFLHVHSSNTVISNCVIPGLKLGGNATVIGGAVGAVHADEGARVVLDGGVIVGPGTPIGVGAGAVVQARDAFLGDRFVSNVEVAAHKEHGVASAHVSSTQETVASVVGRALDTDADHKRVGDALAAHLKMGHDVIAEQPGECGARMRDGALDPQVDVFLRSPDHPGHDVWLQVVRPAKASEEFGEYGSALDLVVDDALIAAAIAQKDAFTDKHLYDLAVSLPVRVGGPMRESLAERAVAFDRKGYARVWLVDADGWVLELGAT
jgi:hypothetical protein